MRRPQVQTERSRRQEEKRKEAPPELTCFLPLPQSLSFFACSKLLLRSLCLAAYSVVASRLGDEGGHEVGGLQKKIEFFVGKEFLASLFEDFVEGLSIDGVDQSIAYDA